MKKFSMQELQELFPGEWEETPINKNKFFFFKGNCLIHYYIAIDEFYLVNLPSKNITTTSIDDVVKFYKQKIKMINFQ